MEQEPTPTQLLQLNTDGTLLDIRRDDHVIRVYKLLARDKDVSIYRANNRGLQRNILLTCQPIASTQERMAFIDSATQRMKPNDLIYVQHLYAAYPHEVPGELKPSIYGICEYQWIDPKNRLLRHVKSKKGSQIGVNDICAITSQLAWVIDRSYYLDIKHIPPTIEHVAYDTETQSITIDASVFHSVEMQTGVSHDIDALQKIAKILFARSMRHSARPIHHMYRNQVSESQLDLLQADPTQWRSSVEFADALKAAIFRQNIPEDEPAFT